MNTKLYAEPPNDMLRFVKEKELAELINRYKKQLEKLNLEKWIITELLQLFVRNMGINISYELALKYVYDEGV